MRLFFFRGLAVAASFALVTAGYAQQIFDQGASRWTRNNTIFGSNTTYSTQEGAAAAATPTPAAQDAAAAAPQAAADATTDKLAGDTSHSYKSYFDGSCCSGGGCDPSANWVVGVYGLVMNRDYEDDVPLSYNPADPTQYFASTNERTGNMGGLQAVIARRGCSGNGFELRYWGLYPQACGCGPDYPMDTALGGLNQVNFGPGTAFDAFNAADYHTFYRSNTFQNFEINLLHCGGSANCGRTNWEWLAGFRYFYFNEDFSYGATGTDPNYPNPVYYDLVTTNNLYGFQLGGRAEHFVTQRFGLQVGTAVGAYGNHIESTQSINDRFGNFGTIASGPNAGQNYAFGSSKDDFAMGAAFNIGGIYQFADAWRVVGGYQVFAITGVALAPAQIPYNFNNTGEIQQINSNNGLILSGVYIGVEHSF